MSLKAFHVVFIVLTVMTCFGVTLWGIVQAIRGPQLWPALLAAGMTLLGVALIIYGRWFLHKLREVSYL
jgi:hypothetical protein